MKRLGLILAILVALLLPTAQARAQQTVQVFPTARFTVGDILYANTTSTLARLGIGTAGQVVQGGTVPAWTSTPTLTTGISLGLPADVFLVRNAAATLQFGTADAAAPVAQTLKFQSVVTGTVDTAGVNATIAGSQGTGTGNGGSLVFQVAYPGLTGNVPNALATVATLSGDNDLAAGTNQLVLLSPTVNQSGAAGYDALAVNLTRTAVGSGVKNLLNLAVGGATRLAVSDGATGVGTQIRGAQATAPTCPTNCGGAGLAVVGSDTAGIVTLGAGPANAFVITFNGTYAAAPSCVVQQQTSAANYVTKALTGATTITVSTAAGPTAADKFSWICVGVQ